MRTFTATIDGKTYTAKAPTKTEARAIIKRQAKVEHLPRTQVQEKT